MCVWRGVCVCGRMGRVCLHVGGGGGGDAWVGCVCMFSMCVFSMYVCVCVYE